MSDYERIAKAITFIESCVDCQPSLEDIAAHLNLSAFHFQRLFCRWAGVTPKRYLQALTLERAKLLLREAKPLLEVADRVGLSSGSRLYDHFVHLEAITPGEFKKGGFGLTIEYGVHDSPFGSAFVAITARGICRVSFLQGAGVEGEIANLRQTWPQATLRLNEKRARSTIEKIFENKRRGDGPLSLYVSGTNFQVSVWKALLAIPPAQVASYSHVANAIARTRSARAVGQAVGANPVAFLIPCHRVIQQSGKLGGYHWGETRKHAIHAWEAARHE